MKHVNDDIFLFHFLTSLFLWKTPDWSGQPCRGFFTSILGNGVSHKIIVQYRGKRQSEGETKERKKRKPPVKPGLSMCGASRLLTA